MNRRLILICNPGEGKSLVSHVPMILDRYKNYFQSPVGGYWHDHEICEMPQDYDKELQVTWLKTQIIDCNSNSVDYSLFVFVGHGGAFLDGEYIQLSKGALFPLKEIHNNSIDQKPTSVKRLIIIDACRDFHSIYSHILIQEQRLFSGESQIQGEFCKELYNKTIFEANSHIEMIQSTQYGAKAGATTTGSVFSDAFFKVLNDNIPLWNTEALGISCGQFVKNLNDIFSPIKDEMGNNYQVPQYRTNDKTSHFPIYAVWRPIEKRL